MDALAGILPTYVYLMVNHKVMRGFSLATKGSAFPPDEGGQGGLKTLRFTLSLTGLSSLSGIDLLGE